MSKRKHKPPECCGSPAKLVMGGRIYPHRIDLHELYFYLCESCGAYVGCHGKTKRAKGTPAGPELRAARMRAHAAFDPLWKTGSRSRGEAYQWLAGELDRDSIHIGESDLETCNEIIHTVKRYRINGKTPIEIQFDEWETKAE